MQSKMNKGGESLKAAIRVDASTEIGSGHVMRCLTLANTLTKQGFKVVFICKIISGYSYSAIEEQGFQIISIKGLITSDFYSDAKSTIDAIDSLPYPIDWLIIDHYQIDREWESAVRHSVGRILVVDDLANRLHDCDILLDQNPYCDLTSRYKTLVPSSCLQLLGLDYLMLRSEFISKSNCFIKESEIATNILITMGGTDEKNITSLVLNALSKANIQVPLSIRVAVGSGCPHFDIIKKVSNTVKTHQILIERQISNISEWMEWSDLAICGGGFTSYELAFMGVPTFVITTSPTQLEAATTLNRLKINQFIGEFKTLSMDDLVENLIYAIFNSQNRMELSLNAKKKIDGQGVDRVVNQLMKAK
jgi:UDP-2,4-diacetamido-2,4,6-trideoxy-beta-L-altropyranose hydrolase